MMTAQVVPVIIAIVVMFSFVMILVASAVFDSDYAKYHINGYVRVTRWVTGVLCAVLWGGTILIAIAGVFRAVNYLIFG